MSPDLVMEWGSHILKFISYVEGELILLISFCRAIKEYIEQRKAVIWMLTKIKLLLFRSGIVFKDPHDKNPVPQASGWYHLKVVEPLGNLGFFFFKSWDMVGNPGTLPHFLFYFLATLRSAASLYPVSAINSCFITGLQPLKSVSQGKPLFLFN